MLFKCSAIIFVLFSVCITQGWTARILCFFVSPSISHVIIHSAIAKTMVERGHNVTVVTSIPFKDSNAGYRHIELDVPTLSRDFVKEQTVTQKEGLLFRFFLFKFLSKIYEMSDNAMRHQKVKELMNEEFDLVILGYFLNDFHLGLGAHFKCPIVISWMIHPVLFINEMIGNPSEIFYVPTGFLSEQQPLNFLGRVKNFLFHLMDSALIFIHNYVMASYYKEYFPPDKYPSLEEMKRNISLVFANHHFTQGPIRPNVPALIEIGGIQIKEKPDPLPQDIQKVLDQASDAGAIYFSLGSNVYTSELRPEIIDAFYNIFFNLKQKVLWKWENDIPPGNSSNIVFKKWFPQNDILAHPNLKLFITHGGKGSIVESEYHGVPMIGIPAMADQIGNAQQMQNAGFGIKLDIATLTEKSLREAILEVLQNPKYSENVKRFSKLYRDRPQKPKEIATFWLEYVLRHKGAPHMQSPLVHMNTFQRLGLDVMGFVFLIVYILIKIVITIIKFIFRKIFRSSVKPITKKKKKA